MKRKSIALTAILALALVAVISAGATLAYLTDKDNTGTVSYTITPDAFLDITLDEPIWKAGNLKQPGFFDGKEAILSAERKMIKDPQVTVVEGSVDCYVRLHVLIDKELAKVMQYPPKEYDKWVAVKESGTDSYYEYYYYYPEIMKSGQTTPRAFDYIEFKSHTKAGKNMEEFFGPAKGTSIIVKAEAIQAEGFDSYTDAPWNDAENLWVNN